MLIQNIYCDERSTKSERISMYKTDIEKSINTLRYRTNYISFVCITLFKTINFKNTKDKKVFLFFVIYIYHIYILFIHKVSNLFYFNHINNIEVYYLETTFLKNVKNQ